MTNTTLTADSQQNPDAAILAARDWGCSMFKHSLPNKLRGAWTTLERNYRMTLAENLKAALADGDSEAINDAYTSAVDAILLTPAETLPDIRLKIEVMREHEIEDGWWCAKEALALLAIDAGRLIDPTREGGAA